MTSHDSLRPSSAPSSSLTSGDAATASAAAAALRHALEAAFAGDHIEVQDDSHLHAGHAGASEGSHFTVRLVSTRFAGLTRVARHRLVYSSLGPLPALGIHALAIEARAPGEAQSNKNTTT